MTPRTVQSIGIASQIKNIPSPKCQPKIYAIDTLMPQAPTSVEYMTQRVCPAPRSDPARIRVRARGICITAANLQKSIPYSMTSRSLEKIPIQIPGKNQYVKPRKPITASAIIRA